MFRGISIFSAGGYKFDFMQKSLKKYSKKIDIYNNDQNDFMSKKTAPIFEGFCKRSSFLIKAFMDNQMHFIYVS